MKMCKGCGAFYEDKCPYCGYVGKEEDTKYKDKKYVTLKLHGNNNDIHIQYGECSREIMNIKGNNLDMNVLAEFINVEVRGNNNDVRVDSKIKYFCDIHGNNNDIYMKVRALYQGS